MKFSQFSMRNSPVQPKRGTRVFYYELYEDGSILELVSKLAASIASAHDRKEYAHLTEQWMLTEEGLGAIEIRAGDYEGCCGEISLTVPESDEAYGVKMKTYEKTLASYNKWLVDHADDIANWKRREKEAADKAKRKEAERAVKQKEREKEELKEELNRIQDRLSKLKAEEK